MALARFRPKTSPRNGSSYPVWLADCMKDDRGHVVPNLANILVALRSAPELVAAIG